MPIRVYLQLMLAMSLLASTTAMAQSHSTDELQQLVSDWISRSERIPRFHYELVGTQTIKANSKLAYDEETGDDIPGRYFPPQDLSTEFNRDTMLDPGKELFRVVTDSATLDAKGTLYKWPRTVATWDGNSTSNQMLVQNAPDHGIPQVEFKLNGNLQNFWPHWSQIDQALCFAHGHFLAKHQFGYIYESISTETLINKRDLQHIYTLPNDVFRYRLANDKGLYELDCETKEEHRPLRIACYAFVDEENRLMFETSLEYASADPQASVVAGTCKTYDHVSARNQLTDVINFKIRTFDSSKVGFETEKFTLTPAMNAICVDWPTNRIYKFVPVELKWYQSLTFWVASFFLVVLIAVVSRRALNRHNYA